MTFVSPLSTGQSSSQASARKRNGNAPSRKSHDNPKGFSRNTSEAQALTLQWREQDSVWTSPTTIHRPPPSTEGRHHRPCNKEDRKMEHERMADEPLGRSVRGFMKQTDGTRRDSKDYRTTSIRSGEDPKREQDEFGVILHSRRMWS